INGYVVGCYSFGGVIKTDNTVSVDRWAIRCAKTGMNIATFTDRFVAVNFLRWLWNTYGDITETLLRCYEYKETSEDSRLMDEINARSKHETRVYMTVR
ncbi:MAG TPA: hypothetical protein VFK47_19725, partial [Ktedonobacteraceae bacterium]|nr:hypothetical protein [Ktedonobacteraceae bacterium]